MRSFFAAILLFIACVSSYASIWLETGEGLGYYRYLEKDATTYVHYGVNWASWNRSEVWIDVNGTGAAYTGGWVHDSGADKHLSTGNLNSANHANWAAGALIDIYCKIDSDAADPWGEESSDVDYLRIVDVVNNNAPATNLYPLQSAGRNLVMDFTINAATAETLQRLWVQNTGTLQETDHIGNTLFLYYENAPGDGFGGTESKLTLWGNYGGNSTSDECWGHDALGLSIPSGGLRCYVVVSNLTKDYQGKTAQFQIINDGINLVNGRMRINATLNSSVQIGNLRTTHKITIDGVNYFSTNERFLTTSTGYTNWITWDSNYLYVGYYGEDVDAASADYLIVAYFSTNTNTGSCYGVTYLNQQAVLPFRADFAFNFLSDYTWDSATWNGSSWNWGADPFTVTTGTDIARIGNFVVWRINRSQLGNRNWLDMYLQFVKKVSGSEWSYGAIPSNTFVDGNHSVRSAANPSNYVSFGTDVWKFDKTPYAAAYKKYDTIAPYTNNLFSPANGAAFATGSTIALSNFAWDNIGLYKVEFWTNGGVYLTSWASNAVSNRAATIASSTLGSGTHRLFTIAYDTHNRRFSRTNSITVVVNTPPPAPVLTYPANNDSYFYLLKPRYRWTQGADTDGQAVTNFRIIVSENANLTSPKFDYTFSTLLTNFLTPFTNYLENNKTYYWAVRASDGVAWGAWSTTNHFTVNPQFIKLDGSIGEWGTATFTGDNRDQISNGQWRWNDRVNDARNEAEAQPYDHIDLLQFRLTANTNCLYFMFTVPDTTDDMTYDSPRPYISVAIDTNFASGSGYINTKLSESGVASAASWEMEMIANVDGTGYFYPSTGTNFHECGENWITHTSPGLGEIAVLWSELGFSQVPRRLRLTVDTGRVQDGLGIYYINDITGSPDFVDCISTNSGDAWAELSDSVNNCYFDLNFETNGRVIENRFQVTAPATAYAGVPFKVVVKALTFLGGEVQDFNRAIVALALTNGNAFIVSNNGWHNGVATNIVVINAAGSNKIIVQDKLYTNLNGTSGWILVYRPDIHINEVAYDPLGSNADGQWIELFNAGETVYLTNWAIDDEDGTFPMYRVRKNVIIPTGAYFVLYDDSTGGFSDDLNFSDGRGIIYGDWGSSRLGVSQDEVGLFCSADYHNRYTLMDFMAYGVDADDDEAYAVQDGIWTTDDGAAITLFTEGSSLVLLPDGDDNDLGTDWSVDHTATPKFTNSCIVYANLALSPQTIGSYRGSILLAYAIRLVDPENDALANGDRLSNLVICLGGTITSADVAEARLYRDNGAGQFNYGYRNNGRTNNLLMGVGTYSNGCYVFTGLSNNLIANSVTGGYDWAYLALKLATNATIGRTVNPYVRENGIGMQSTGSAKTGPVDYPVSNANVQRIREGYFVANEWSDADWAGGSDYLYQFVEVYNNSATNINPATYGWHASTVGGGDALSFARGSTFEAGKFALIVGGSTTTAACTNYYSENPSCPVLITPDTMLGSAGLAANQTPFILRESNNIIAIINFTNSYTATRYTVERINPYGADTAANIGSSSITNGTPGYLNGFRAVETGLSDVAAYSLDIYTTNNVVMDFYIPNNNGAADVLSLVTIYNNGTAVAADVTFNLKRDGASGGFDGDEVDLGAFASLGSGRWQWTGSETISNTGAVSRWRYYVTADVPATTTDGRTVRLQLERLNPYEPGPYTSTYTSGASVSSFNDGPVDAVSANVSTQVCGIANFVVSKIVTNIQLTLGGLPVPGSIVTYAITYSNLGNGNGHNVVLYDRIPTGSTYYTNYAGSATGWEAQFSDDASPDQSYNSADYNSNLANAVWFRWRKALVNPAEDGATLFVGVTID